MCIILQSSTFADTQQPICADILFTITAANHHLTTCLYVLSGCVRLQAHMF